MPGFVRRWLRLMSLPYTDAVAGAPGQAPLTMAGETVGVTICYEDVFGAEQIHYLPEATLLVNVSNDAWFGDTIAPHQHLQIARVRSAEVSRYTLRRPTRAYRPSSIPVAVSWIVRLSLSLTFSKAPCRVTRAEHRMPYGVIISRWRPR
ncbi:MAG: hypothetical protein CM1200mP36_01590 [Gammaproteobacteria bacterium]|nr:MAG: hypothetical protein CM1200mP36_01590 [Gammaproteobacteria bacterium]